MVVFPTPGGPQNTSDDSAPEASMTPSGASGPRTCGWPMTSASARGRSRSASGRGALSSPAAGGSTGSGPGCGSKRSGMERM